MIAQLSLWLAANNHTWFDLVLWIGSVMGIIWLTYSYYNAPLDEEMD